MPIATTCPKCQALFRLPDELAGRRVKCQKCAAVFEAPVAASDTTMPGVLVASEPEPALAQAGPVRAPSILPPPLPADQPSPKLEFDPTPVEESYSDKRPERPADGKQGGADRSSIRRDRKPKTGSKAGLIAGILGLCAIAFIACAIGMGIWRLAANDRPGRGKPIAKPQPIPKFEQFPGAEFPIPDHPAFDGFKDGKEPEPPPPGPPGSIPVIFDKDGTFRNNNQITLNDPMNAERTRFKLYIVRLEAGYTYQFDMTSKNWDALDPLLFLTEADGKFAAKNDDILEGRQRDARLIFTPRESGVFHLEATHWANPNAPNIGPFTLTVRHVK